VKHVVFVPREPERLSGLGIAVICMPEAATTNSCKRIASLRGSICDFALPVKDKGRGAPPTLCNRLRKLISPARRIDDPIHVSQEDDHEYHARRIRSIGRDRQAVHRAAEEASLTGITPSAVSPN